jgi:UDP-2-acetamido-2-deoxy-ribo-hexuluronate aminotransferase
MQFIDLKKQYAQIQKNIDTRFRDIMSDTRFIMGKEVKELESILADYTGTKYCFTCANGTDALEIALMALNIGAGDAVFVPSFTFYSTAEVVNLTGAVPVFVDVKSETFNLDPKKLETAIQNVINEGRLQPKAVIPVDLFGLPADYPTINEIADKYGIIVVEDGAQGFGGSINGRKACSFGHISTTSFFPAKPLGCYGDGGAIFTDDDYSAVLIDSIRIHGRGNDKYQNVRIGLNSRLDTLQAAVLLEKIKLFDDELIKRDKRANLYHEGLKDVLIAPEVEKSDDRQFFSSWAQYSVLARDDEERTKIMDRLKERGVPTMIYYKIPLHLQEVYNKDNLKRDYCSLEASEDLCKRVFSLPMHPYLEESETEYIIESIREICRIR